MAVGLPYVLHGLVTNDLAEQCSLAYLTWRMLLDNELFTEGPSSTDDAVNGMGSVTDLRAAGIELQRLMNLLNQSNTGTGEDIDGALCLTIFLSGLLNQILGIIKFHKVGHWPDWILEFGEPGNYNGETWETAHKWWVKRWIGKMALNGNGAICTLLRRNTVSEARRFSSKFDESYSTKRLRHSSLVMGRVTDTLFNKFYCTTDNEWVSISDTVAFGLNGDDSFKIGFVEEIRVVLDDVKVSVRLYNESPSSFVRPLGKMCRRRLLDSCGTPLVINLKDDNVYVSLFSIQPDFVEGGVYDCPFMSILN